MIRHIEIVAILACLLYLDLVFIFLAAFTIWHTWKSIKGEKEEATIWDITWWSLIWPILIRHTLLRRHRTLRSGPEPGPDS